MRRSRRKFIAWLTIAVMSLNPFFGAFAADGAPLTDCQIVPAAIAADYAADHAEDCAQHYACTSYCQFAPLLPPGPAAAQAGPRPWFAHGADTENIVTRFLDGIERPPRV